MNPTNPEESLVHRRTLNKPESLQILGFGFANPYWFQKIHFVVLFLRPFLKDSFPGFVLWICFWKICLVASFRENKKSKLLDSFCFRRIRVRIPHPYDFIIFLIKISQFAEIFEHEVAQKVMINHKNLDSLNLSQQSWWKSWRSLIWISKILTKKKILSWQNG